MLRAAFIGLLFLAAVPCVAQQLALPEPASNDYEQLSRVLPALAKQAIEVYREGDRATYLSNLLQAQIVAGQYAAAIASIEELRASRTADSLPPTWLLTSELVSRAKFNQQKDGSSFDAALERAFADIFGKLDNRISALAYRALIPFQYPADVTSQVPLPPTLKEALASQTGRHEISLSGAIELIQAYREEQAHRALSSLIPSLIDSDDKRRYLVDKDVLVKTPDGASICVFVMRPRQTTGKLPTLLNFTIYADPVTTVSEARRTASNSYVGVEGYTRGKACSPDKPVPIEHDGTDADTVIKWISRQPWSDGRVGMYGGSYEGFTQWAAAKHMPKALKALMPSVTFAPGVDFPMPGGIFQTYGYPWPFFTTNNKTLDSATYGDTRRWNNLNHDWYVSGRAYRDLDQIDGTPNPVWNRWVSHPTQDTYWQNAIPYGREFARIDIPVLTTTGYYDGGQIGALYYFTQHNKYLPSAEHYLVIGPYDHITGQRGTGGRPDLRGYDLDPVAHLNIGELRYQWFDYVLRGAPKPTVLQDRVNYEVMGANVWRHVPSIAAMSGQRLRFYLSAERSENAYRLSEGKPLGSSSISQTVDFADRSDVTAISAPEVGVDSWNDDELIVNNAVRFYNGMEFISKPLEKPVELSGLFSGKFDLLTNKRDFDFNIQIYELTPSGKYMQLSYYAARASLVPSLTRRRLLVPGRRQQLDFRCNVLTSRQLHAGSELVIVLKIVKRPDMQIDYGTGKDVSDETIADATSPLRVRWFGDSFVELPVRR